MTKLQSLLTWRTARWAVLAAAVPALWACNSRRLVAPTPAPQMQFNDLFQQSINRNIDIVFMVDDSLSMAPIQTKLTAQFPTFMNVLKNLPNGLPNVHIGVVSSSMGAGRNPGVDHCPQGGDQGMFHTRPLGGAPCMRASLNANQNFIINVNGQANYTGDISDVFSCIALLGENGCGFEHQFESVLRALGADGAPAPASNAGFLRDDAYLAIILITNEDDCSAPPNSDLFDNPDPNNPIGSMYGPLQSYRCNEFGHLCAGQRPPRQPPGEVDLTGMCVSAEGEGKLLHVADVVAAMKSVKADPSKVLVAAIAGPNNPYKVNIGPSQVKGDPSQWPYVEHSCVENTAEYADPSVRIQQWVEAFGGNGVFETLCAPDFSGALTRIAEAIGKKIGSPCVTGTVLDTTGQAWVPGATPDCSVIDHLMTGGGTTDSTLPPCADQAMALKALTSMPPQTFGTQACWVLSTNATTCPGSQIMLFNRPGAPVTTELNSTVSCSLLTCPVTQKIGMVMGKPACVCDGGPLNGMAVPADGHCPQM
jgi:hypothetical protein